MATMVTNMDGARLKQGQHLDPLTAERPDPATWPERRQRAFLGAAQQQYGAALLRDGIEDVRAAVIDDLAAYFGFTAEECVQRCVNWEEWSVQEWQARTRSSPEALADFYHTVQSWAFDLLWYAYLQAEGFAYPVAVAAAETLPPARPGARHLDFGSGTGITSQLFMRLGYESDLADVSTSLLAFAGFRLERRGLNARRIDLNVESLAARRYDVITAIDTLVHVPDVAETARQLHRALRPGGTLFANFDVRPATAENAWHLYSDDLPLRWALQRAGFEPQESLDGMLTRYRWVEPHGPAHLWRGSRDLLLLRSPLRPAYRRARTALQARGHVVAADPLSPQPPAIPALPEGKGGALGKRSVRSERLPNPGLPAANLPLLQGGRGVTVENRPASSADAASSSSPSLFRGGDRGEVPAAQPRPTPSAGSSRGRPPFLSGKGAGVMGRRILLVLQTAKVGGMETHCLDLAGEYVRRGIAVAVVLPCWHEFDDLARNFQRRGARVLRIPTDARDGRRPQLAGLARLARLLRGWRPDAVHLHTGGATGGAAVVALARAAGATTVITEHDVPREGAGRKDRLARRAIDRLAHAVVAVSHRNADVRRERLGRGAAHGAVVLNGVPLPALAKGEQQRNREQIRAQLGVAPATPLIGCVVRLAEGKGLDTLLRAFALVRAERECALLLVGDGPLRSELEALAAELGVHDALRFAGQQADPAPWFDALDVFALAVPAGSMSIALLEALARGLPAVITFWNPDEALIPEQTGLAAPPNDPPALAAQIARLVDDPELRQRLGAHAAAHVAAHYSVARVADDLLAIYAR